MVTNNRYINRVLKARDTIDTRRALLRGVHVLLLFLSTIQQIPALAGEVLDPRRFRTHTDDAGLLREYSNSL